MERELIDKNVEILVLFARGMRESGSIPMIYKGKLLNIDDNYYKIHVWDSEAPFSGILGGLDVSNNNGVTLFNKDYVIYLKEI